MIPIRRVLISVSDKTDLLGLARCLHSLGAEILSTGGTARHLRSGGLPVVDVADYTGSPEILDGRVKTLHPRVHAGLLAMRDKPDHVEQLNRQKIPLIDMVVVNLYPFREVAARRESSFEEVVEQIDIGGPSMVRSAAKNHASVAVLTDPRDYGWITQELTARGGCLSPSTLFFLAQKAFALTASYDSAISAWLAERTWSAEGVSITGREMPRIRTISLQKTQNLRYGENPHQRAALYESINEPRRGIAGAEFLHGKELSYNNLLDADAAWNLIREFESAAAAVIKHTNPSGVAQADTLAEAYVLARESDPVSAFGSVVALNRHADEATARQIHSTFVEVVLAPDYTSEALEILRQKKNIRVVKVGMDSTDTWSCRTIDGGFLVQDKDVYQVRPAEFKVVTRRAPTPNEAEALDFGWRVVKHVKSNAIVFCDSRRTLGIGAGQMSRVDSVHLGARKALLPLEGCALASDAFFPFADGLLAAADCGARAVIQPGGSVRDAEVIEAADARDIAMVFTGIRHFRH